MCVRVHAHMRLCGCIHVGIFEISCREPFLPYTCTINCACIVAKVLDAICLYHSIKVGNLSIDDGCVYVFLLV